MEMSRNLYFDLSSPAAFWNLRKLVAALKSKCGEKPRDIKAWLLKQDGYTLHRPLRKHFPRNPYDVTNVMDVWECDLMGVQTVSKYNDKYKYPLSVIDVFSKFLHIVPLMSKTGTAVASAFRSILTKYSHRSSIWVRTDRGKEFLNRSFQDMLKEEDIQFQVCRDLNVKCAIVERSYRTIRDKLYKYLTYKNTYRYIDVLSKFDRGFNDTVHNATGMAPSKVTDSDILAVWNKMRVRYSSIRRAPVRFKVGQHVLICEEKLKLAKGRKQNYTSEIFRIQKVVHKIPRPVYELQHLLGKILMISSTTWNLVL
jgi:hypothetical protein